MSQRDLSGASRVPQAKLSRVERSFGGTDLADEEWESVADALSLPLAFFGQDERAVRSTYPHEMFKRQATVKLRDVRTVRARLNVSRIAIQNLQKLVGQDPDIPSSLEVSDAEEVTPEQAADRVRHALQIPDGPIADLTHWIEAVGIFVLTDARSVHGIDGVSQWARGQSPVILINGSIEQGRSRFCLAHELGHVVLHTARSVEETEEEKEANEFASQLLLPASEFRLTWGGLSDNALSKLKAEWGVSKKALVYRAHQLGLIGRSEYNAYWRHYSASRGAAAELRDGLVPVERGRLGEALVNEAVEVSSEPDWDSVAKRANVGAEDLESVFRRVPRMRLVD